MSKRREQRPPSRKEKRALREIQRAEERAWDPYECQDPYESPQEPTVEEMLEASEGQLPDR